MIAQMNADENKSEGAKCNNKYISLNENKYWYVFIVVIFVLSFGALILNAFMAVLTCRFDIFITFLQHSKFCYYFNIWIEIQTDSYLKYKCKIERRNNFILISILKQQNGLELLNTSLICIWNIFNIFFVSIHFIQRFSR